MNKEILVDATGFSIRVAVIENGTPVELYVEQEGTSRLVGNIYLGRVQNVLPGMQAAFIDIGQEKNAFLYAGDVVMPDDSDGDISREDLKKELSIDEMLRPGQNVIVQVEKDPVGTKGARVTTHLTLAGRSLVLMPTMDYIGVSRRIDKEEERTRLRRLVTEKKPEGMGIIARTACAGKTGEMLEEEIESLTLLYADIRKKANGRKKPGLLHEEQSLLFRTVRDHLMKDVDRVFVNDEATFEQLRSIAEVMAPKLKARILLKKSENLFERCESESKIDKALSRKVSFKNGSYIVIDRTEALTCIDVNTGKFVGKDDLEKTITATNCEAAKEIARQLRLRDIGGIIIIDFIDMEKETNRQLVLNTLKTALKDDHTRCHVFGFTHLGLVEMTRKKTGKCLGDTLQVPCPCCGGDARVLSPESVMLKIRRQTLSMLKGIEKKQVLLEVHPSVLQAMKKAEKEHGSVFPPEAGGSYYVRPCEASHPEQFTVRPLNEKKFAEIKKECQIIH